MGTLFSETLVKLRKEAGFPTAYRFYHDNGGAPVLQLTYRKYLMMEQGEIMPLIGRLQRIITAMRIPLKTPAANELVTAWLRTLADGEAYENLLAPMLKETPPPALSPVQEALKRSLADKKYYMTTEQFRAALSSLEAYKCSMIMFNDSAPQRAEAIAAALGIPKGTAERSLKLLAKVKLVKELKKGVYRSKLAGRMVVYPNLRIEDPKLHAKWKDYLTRLEQDGTTEYGSRGIIRADALALRGLFPFIHANIETANTYAVTKKTEKSAFFYVIGKVVRLWDF